VNTKRLVSSALTVVAGFICMTFVVRPTVVSGASMMPTLHDKDVLIASPLAKELFQPARGDIVIICLSENPFCGFSFSEDTQYVKRIVAVPGDTVRYGACEIFVSTAAGENVRDAQPTLACRERGDLKQVVIPDGMFFVAGDNRRNSLDSRTFGPVSKSQIHASVLAQMRLTWTP
jgi:signal peptidase I